MEPGRWTSCWASPIPTMTRLNILQDRTSLGMNSIGINDEMTVIGVTEPSPGLGIPLGFLDVSHNKLILWIEAAVFELTRVGESGNK